MKGTNELSLEEQLCPWTLCKEILTLGGPSDSYFMWTHPWSRVMYKENKRRYVIIEWYHLSRRQGYPAYHVAEILRELPIGFILGRAGEMWYCKDSESGWNGVEYYGSAIEACAHAYIAMLRSKK